MNKYTWNIDGNGDLFNTDKDGNQWYPKKTSWELFFMWFIAFTIAGLVIIFLHLQTLLFIN
jgi:hypothetical protein